MAKKYDFCGWATRNDLLCADGRTIRRDAFKDCDGKKVPLFWNHEHGNVSNILGHGLLRNEPEGVRVYGSFNDTEAGKNAKLSVEHGDVEALSIWANELKQIGGDVIHGTIREVSLVPAGANPGAFIDDVIVHGADTFEGEIFTDESLELYHAAADDDEDDAEDEESDSGTTKTIGAILDTMNDEQKAAVYELVGLITEGQGEEEESAPEPTDNSKGGSEMKHNIFDAASGSYAGTRVDEAYMRSLLADAKSTGSLKAAVENRISNGELTHALTVPMDGMEGPSAATAEQTYGFRDPDMLFPEYKSLNTPPEWIKRDTTWVGTFLNGAHHTPFSRIKSMFADLTEDEARARGYIKGHLKKEQVFSLLKRTTDPQTVYKKQKIDRDDTIDIVDFDVVAWIKGEMRGQLDEEIARAGLIGDGRLPSSDDKISDQHIRPIATDVPLFTIRETVDPGKNEQEMAKNFIVSAIKARKTYKGSGNPILFTTEDILTAMLLIEDGIGHFLYASEQELCTRLRVSRIVTVEVMEGFHVDTTDGDQSTGVELLGIIVNPKDYTYGADKGGAVSMFDDFDIDYNQMKYLIETRCSGALTKPFSAIRLTKATA